MLGEGRAVALQPQETTRPGLLLFFFFPLFWQYWDLNSGSTLRVYLEPLGMDFFFFKIGSLELLPRLASNLDPHDPSAS
jgi:hypothetical protein